MNKPLHVVCFNNPYPPSYGGTIEVYFKIKALHEVGFAIYLHCFTREIPPSTTELNTLVEEVYFYKVSYNPLHLFSSLPLSVISRNHKDLVSNITKVEAPILYESLRTTLSIHDARLKGYKKILRLHNIEQDYHSGIAKSEKNLIKKGLNWLEGKKYERYENVISNFDKVYTLSIYENDYINKKFHNAVYVPVFHGNERAERLTGVGKYAFYHGDLETADNRKAAGFLIEIFKEIKNYPLVIASGTNEQYINTLIGNAQNISFIKLKDFSHLKQLLNDAHINLIWSFQRSGTKLKLINSLFHSRYCIINDNIVDDPVVSGLCIYANSKEGIIESLNNLRDRSYADSNHRAEILESYLNDIQNAKQISALL